MSKPIYVFKPSLTNALFPHFFRNFLYTGLFIAVLYGVALVARTLNFWDDTLILALNIPFLVFAAVFFAMIPLGFEAVKLMNTRYELYQNRIVYKYKFITIRNYSATYNQIVNLKTIINIWDRITGCGDIVVHTADDSRTDLTLNYVKNPQHVERKLNELMNKAASTQSSSTSNDFSFK